MKKILLIIFLVIIIFQLEILSAGEIAIGQECKNRQSSASSSDTWINEGEATGTGTITTVYIWAYAADLTDVEVAIFEEVSPNHFTTRDSEAIGTVVAGAKRTFSVDLDVVEGDRIGIWSTGGLIERDTSGYLGIWYDALDRIPCTNYEFTTFLAGHALSLEGVGDTVAVGWDGPFNTVTITKWNNIEISKWNTIE